MVPKFTCLRTGSEEVVAGTQGDESFSEVDSGECVEYVESCDRVRS
jgi:hypothetical protein